MDIFRMFDNFSSDNRSSYSKSDKSNKSNKSSNTNLNYDFDTKLEKNNKYFNDNKTDSKFSLKSDLDSYSYSDVSSDSDLSSKKKKRKLSSENKKDMKDAIKSFNEVSKFTKINRYFQQICPTENIIKMIDIINEEHEISLRLLNWFAMKYSLTIESLDIIKSDGKKELFDIKISYDAQLKSHSKKYFDPFRRGTRFDYYYDPKDKTKKIETTICQLNFFMWLFSNNLMDYVENNFKFLKDKMGYYEKNKKEIKQKQREAKKRIVKNKNIKDTIKVERFNDKNISKLIITM